MSRGRYQLAGRRDVVVPVVLEVQEEDELGRPTKCVMRYDDETLDLAKESVWKDGKHRFWIIYMGEKDAKLTSGGIKPKAKA